MRNNLNFYDTRVGFDYYLKLLNVAEATCSMRLSRLSILKLRSGFGPEVTISLRSAAIISTLLHI